MAISTAAVAAAAGQRQLREETADLHQRPPLTTKQSSTGGEGGGKGGGEEGAGEGRRRANESEEKNLGQLKTRFLLLQ